MNILITGATGLIGQALCKFLMNHHQLTILTRDEKKAYLTIGHHVSAIESLAQCDINQIDVVINLAGEPIANKRWSEKQKHAIENSRFSITEQLVCAIKAAGNPPHTFISGSAIGYYGRQNNPVDESHTDCFNEFSHQLCKQWESIANQAHSDATRVCILRTGIVLSKRGGALQKMAPPVKLCLGGPIGSGQQQMSWIHIDDMVGIILHLIDNPALAGIFNATAPNPVDNNEFSKTLAETLKRPNLFRMPATVAQLLFGEMSDLLIYGQAVLPNHITQAGFRFHYPDLQGALKQIYSSD